MLYAIICHDKPDHIDTRMQTRPAHLAYLQSLESRLKFAGPFMDDDDKPNGSLIVIEAKDHAQAKTIADQDPYAQKGLFQSRMIYPWNWTINNPENQ